MRGKLSFQYLGLIDKNVALGDPMVLIDLVTTRSSFKDIDIGLVPHTINASHFRNSSYSGRFTIIDPRLPPMEVINLISRCKRLISQSLHGLIVADAFGVPNIWLEPSSNIIGGQFKFLDYFSTVCGNTEPISIFELEECHPTNPFFDVRRFKFNKLEYRSILTEALYKLNVNEV